MRRGALRGFGRMGVVACAAALPAALALAQSAPFLRGTQDFDDRVTLPAPAITSAKLRLSKPASVTRIGRTRPPLRAALADFAEPRPVGSAAPQAAADALPALVLEPVDGDAARRRQEETDPFEPLGVRAGAFLLRPTIEVDLGYDDNPGRQPGKVEGAAFTALAPSLDFASEWARHELRGSVSGEYTRYFGIEDPDRPKLDALISSRIDARA